MPSSECVSVSCVVSDWLDQKPQNPQVLACFDKVINVSFVSESGPQIFALCSTGIGNGPLNILIDIWPKWPDNTVRAPIVIRDHKIELGGTVIDYAAASRWNPLPDWDAIRDAHGAVAPSLLCAAATEYSSCSPLLAWVCGARDLPVEFSLGLSQLDLWWHSHARADLVSAAAALAGLGEGLTPAGDDFLCGLLLGIRSTTPAPSALCSIVANTAAPLTTALSAAFLHSAARGEVNAVWIEFLRDLGAARSLAQLDSLVRNVTAAGYSSGADMLAGYLWLCRVFANDHGGTRHCA
jgi:hypothetical protein